MRSLGQVAKSGHYALHTLAQKLETVVHSIYIINIQIKYPRTIAIFLYVFHECGYMTLQVQRESCK